jgi:hypothetical protein
MSGIRPDRRALDLELGAEDSLGDVHVRTDVRPSAPTINEIAQSNTDLGGPV